MEGNTYRDKFTNSYGYQCNFCQTKILHKEHEGIIKYCQCGNIYCSCCCFNFEKCPKCDSPLKLYSREQTHKQIERFFEDQTNSSDKMEKLCSLLSNLLKGELRIQCWLLYPHFCNIDDTIDNYFDWITSINDCDLEEFFRDFYIKLCTSDANSLSIEDIYSNVSQLIIQYVNEYIVSTDAFICIANEPKYKDCDLYINHLLEVFSIENDPQYKISEDFIKEQFNIFKSNFINCIYDVKFGRSMFVVFKVLPTIFNQTQDESYGAIMDDILQEIQNDEDIDEKIRYNGFDFEKLSEIIFDYAVNR